MKRIRLVVALAAVAIAGCLALVILRAREPRYEGRTLTEWISSANDAKERWYATLSPKNNGFSLLNHPVEDPDWRAATRAVKAMTPASIPILLRWASAKESRQIIITTKQALNNFFGWHLETRPARALNIKAYVGFDLLGSDGKEAWPALIQRTSSPDPHLRQNSIICLFASGAPDGMIKPVLRRLEQDPDTTTATIAGVLDRERFQRDAGADPIQ